MVQLNTISDEEELERQLSEPTQRVIDTLSRLSGDLLILGAGGKMGPSIARMSKRALESAGSRSKVIAVARFSNETLRERLEAQGIETLACDLTDAQQFAQLPDATHIVYMVGMKFGSTARPADTWATNCLAPYLVCSRFPRSQIVAFSTGNVYGYAPVNGNGSRESDVPKPVGEYAMTALGRERMFEYGCGQFGNRVALLRLNYACDLRYGVLVDLAEKVLAGEPVDLSMGYVNTIWQGDANAMSLCAFEHVSEPPRILNLTGAEKISIREAAEEFGRVFGKQPKFVNTELPDALLSDSALGHQMLGSPRYSAIELLQGVAHWLQRGGPRLGKPTHYEAVDGKF